MISAPSEGESRRHLQWFTVLTVTTILLLASDPSRAVTCTVPGTHATLAAAIQDTNCSTIQLAARGYYGDLTITRSLMLWGQAAGGTTIRGTVSVLADAVVDLRDLQIFSVGPDQSLLVTDGASVTSRGVTVDCCSDPLFSDGFESGNISAWSASAP